MNLPRRLACVALVLLVAVFTAEAAPPQIAKIAVPTLQAGGTATLIIDGTDLTPNLRILLPVPIAEQKVKDGATDKKVQIEVKLADGIAPGVYPLRVASDKGISPPVAVEIDAGASQPFAAQIGALPANLHGTLAGSNVLSTALAGKKGQRLVIEVEARRLGSAVEPIVKLYDPKRVQLAWAQGSNPLGGDARLTATLPVDGMYTLELHDAQYKAGNPGRFRLKIGDLQFADLAFPLAGQRGGKTAFQLVGSVPETVKVEADLSSAPGGSYVRLPLPAGVIGSTPRVLVSDTPEVIEAEGQGKLQEVALPAGINGRLRAPKEEDRYKLLVQPGSKLRFDLLAERAGSPLDGVLVLRNEAGTQLVRGDDQPGTLDPGLEYTVPEGVTSLLACVSDLHGRGGANFIYRLAVTPLGQPDFSLALLDDRPHLPRNGAAIVRVRATRSGYNGPIKLALPGLPEGTIFSGDEIPAGTTETLLSLSAPEGAKLGQSVVQITGSSTEAGVSLQRLALLPETPFSKVQPWVRGELGVAITEPGVIGITWEAEPAGLPLGGNVPAKVKVFRMADTKGPIRLTLLTNQDVPKGKDKKDDLNRAIRLEGMPQLTDEKAPEQTSDLKILIPADLPPLTYDLAVRAELIGADKKTVVATAVTPAKRLNAAK
ncbi:MAG: hypothetical protein JNM56_03940 [Planctomycetia bacterium]|nr:hypothetical protein [Planctomycetia bacterium]